MKKLKRYNFDKIPKGASGFCVHEESMEDAKTEADKLAKENGYYGMLQFRDYEKCPVGHCNICHNK